MYDEPPEEAIREELRPLVLCLRVGAGVSMLLQLGMIAFWMLGIWSAQSQGGPDAKEAMVGLSTMIGVGVLSLLVGAFVLFGAGRLAALRSYGVCMAAAILALVPCASPCCFVTLPFGVWALITLSKPEVRSAFTT